MHAEKKLRKFTHREIELMRKIEAKGLKLNYPAVERMLAGIFISTSLDSNQAEQAYEKTFKYATKKSPLLRRPLPSCEL